MLNIRVDSKLSIADAKLRVLARRIVNTQDEERTRIARELHDGVLNMLAAIKFQIEASIFKLRGTPEQSILGDVPEKLKHTSTEVRRIVRNLRPHDLELGLNVAIEQLVLNAQDAGISIEFSSCGEVDDLSTAAKVAFYRVTQEALHNINEHAHARHASVKLEGDSRRVKLTVRDNGTGFDMDHINRDPNRGFGLRNMQERVEAVGGKLTITSSPEGTKITAIIPRHSKSDSASERGE